MAIYSIRDLEKLTGIKAHTLRIWEQRYSLVCPCRTESNIRYYTDENLRLLFNIALLNRHGFKISQLAKMCPEELAAQTAEIAQTNDHPNIQIEALTLAMFDMDEVSFEQGFSKYVQESGFEAAMLELVFPFFDKLKLLWLTKRVSASHEKFVSNLIRRKLMCAIDRVSSPARRDADTFVLYAPEGESQELMLLFVEYMLRARSQKVVYLGCDTTLSDLRDTCQALSPRFVFSILQAPPARHSVQGYVDSASESVNGSQLLLTGAQLSIAPVQVPDNATVLHDLSDMVRFLDNLEIKQRNGKG